MTQRTTSPASASRRRWASAGRQSSVELVAVLVSAAVCLAFAVVLLGWLQDLSAQPELRDLLAASLPILGLLALAATLARRRLASCGVWLLTVGVWTLAACALPGRPLRAVVMNAVLLTGILGIGRGAQGALRSWTGRLYLLCLAVSLQSLFLQPAFFLEPALLFSGAAGDGIVAGVRLVALPTMTLAILVVGRSAPLSSASPRARHSTEALWAGMLLALSCFGGFTATALLAVAGFRATGVLSKRAGTRIALVVAVMAGLALGLWSPPRAMLLTLFWLSGVLRREWVAFALLAGGGLLQLRPAPVLSWAAVASSLAYWLLASGPLLALRLARTRRAEGGHATLLDGRLAPCLGTAALLVVGLRGGEATGAFGLAALLLVLSLRESESTAASEELRAAAALRDVRAASALGNLHSRWGAGPQALPWSLFCLSLTALAAAYPWARSGGLGALLGEIYVPWPRALLWLIALASLVFWLWLERGAGQTLRGLKRGVERWGPTAGAGLFRGAAAAAAALALVPAWSALLWHPAEVVLEWPPVRLAQESRGWSETVPAAPYPRQVVINGVVTADRSLPPGTPLARVRFRGTNGQDSRHLLRIGVELGTWQVSATARAAEPPKPWLVLVDGGAYSARYRVTVGQVPANVAGNLQIALQPRLGASVAMALERVVLVPSSRGAP